MFENMKEMEKISPTMCSAKWLQSTIYLYNGQTQSCQKSKLHSISIQEITTRPSALHNTAYKKSIRNEIINGEKPNDCSLCWNTVGNKDKQLNDRIYFTSNENVSTPYIDKIINSKSDIDINPTCLEIAFSNECNCKCIYCGPEFSSSWLDEIKRLGPYPVEQGEHNLKWIKDSGKMPIAVDEFNPYVDAFCRWWPELYKDLKNLRITGGEPLLNQHLWRFLQLINHKPNKDLNLSIFTNLSVSHNIINKLLDSIKSISPKISSFEIFTSCDTYAKDAEYIRDGILYKNFISNITKLLDKKISVNILITFNMLSIFKIVAFLDEILLLRKKYNKSSNQNLIKFSISYLSWPPFLNANLLPSKIKTKYIKKLLSFCDTNSISNEFDNHGYLNLEEINSIKSLCETLNHSPVKIERDNLRHDFGKFIKEYDKRRNKNFATTFPELSHCFETLHGQSKS